GACDSIQYERLGGVRGRKRSPAGSGLRTRGVLLLFKQGKSAYLSLDSLSNFPAGPPGRGPGSPFSSAPGLYSPAPGRPPDRRLPSGRPPSVPPRPFAPGPAPRSAPLGCRVFALSPSSARGFSTT